MSSLEASLRSILDGDATIHIINKNGAVTHELFQWTGRLRLTTRDPSGVLTQSYDDLNKALENPANHYGILSTKPKPGLYKIYLHGTDKHCLGMVGDSDDGLWYSLQDCPPKCFPSRDWYKVSRLERINVN